LPRWGLDDAHVAVALPAQRSLFLQQQAATVGAVRRVTAQAVAAAERGMRALRRHGVLQSVTVVAQLRNLRHQHRLAVGAGLRMARRAIAVTQRRVDAGEQESVLLGAVWIVAVEAGRTCRRQAPVAAI
jgi:hypothetical protein